MDTLVEAVHLFKLRVYAEDTDFGGVVYHANFLKFFERARTEYLGSCAQSLTSINQRFGLSFVIKSVNIDYFKPATLEQQLVIMTRIAKMGTASLVFEQTLHEDGRQEKMCAARVVVVAVNDEIKPAPIPEQLKQELQCGR